MRKILVPTDFSPFAGHAADVAVDLAQKLFAEVHFLTRVPVATGWDGFKDENRIAFPESYNRMVEAKNQFEALKARYAHLNVNIHMVYAHQNLVDSIVGYVELNKVDLIVMGSKGADGISELIVGSNTQKVVRFAPCPVLVVKQNTQNISLKRIVFASDFSEDIRYPFEKLIALARYTKPVIHLLAVGTPPTFDLPRPVEMGNMEAFKKVCESQGISCSIHTFNDVDVERGVSRFAEEVGADAVAIATTGKGLFRRMMTGSISEALVNHLDTPVLTLNTVLKRQEVPELVFFPD